MQPGDFEVAAGSFLTRQSTLKIRMNRRHYLATAIGVGATALTGCITASGSVPAPHVDDARLADGGWKQTDDTTETVFEEEYGSVITVTAKAHTMLYENKALQADLVEKTLGNIDFAPASFFATRVSFTPNFADLPAGAARKEILELTTENAKASFEERLAEMGLADVEESGETTLDVETGETADVVRYRAVFPFESFGLQLAPEKQLTIEGGKLPVDGWLAVWHHEGSVLLAGGGYPAENFARSVDEPLTSAIDVSVDIDLGLQPEVYQEELLALMAAVE